MEDLVPIVLFLTIGLVIGSYFFFRYRSRQAVQQTVRVAMERGQELTPEVLEVLAGDVATGGQRDLRKGVLWLALAAAFGTLALVADEPDAFGVAAFPLMLGIAYLALWRFSSRNTG
ncbi:MAG: DUF6249 domain-containing protein [Pseudomonadales bacterium]